MSPASPHLKVLAVQVLELMMDHSPVAGRKTAMSDLPSPSKSPPLVRTTLVSCQFAAVAELLPAFTSVVPEPAVTDAVLTSMPLAVMLTLPLMVSVSMLPAPGAKLAEVMMTRLPDEPFVPQLPV